MPTPGDALARWIEERLSVTVRRRRPVGGGCIHEAWGLELVAPPGGPDRLFVKSGPGAQLSLLEAEADGLTALAQAAAGSGLLVPQPLACGRADDRAVLVLTWLELEDGGAADWGALGAALARLHRGSAGCSLVSGDRPDAFGWIRDNVIGSSPQRNGWEADWGVFFARRRLAPQLEMLARRGVEPAGARELLAQVPAWLAAHEPDPCLVHGDLWSGNAGLVRGAAGAVFDPAVHRGDREVDLAMARLFGGFPAPFFAGYEAEWPLPPDHRARVDLYNLYHLLNHANLFGGGYVERSRACVSALLARPPR